MIYVSTKDFPIRIAHFLIIDPFIYPLEEREGPNGFVCLIFLQYYLFQKNYKYISSFVYIYLYIYRYAFHLIRRTHCWGGDILATITIASDTTLTVREVHIFVAFSDKYKYK